MVFRKSRILWGPEYNNPSLKGIRWLFSLSGKCLIGSISQNTDLLEVSTYETLPKAQRTSELSAVANKLQAVIKVSWIVAQL